MSKTVVVRTVVTAANEYLSAVKNVNYLDLDRETIRKVMAPKIEYLLAACEAVIDEFEEVQLTEGTND